MYSHVKAHDIYKNSAHQSLLVGSFLFVLLSRTMSKSDVGTPAKRKALEWVEPRGEEGFVISGCMMGSKTLYLPTNDVMGIKLLELQKGNRELARALGMKLDGIPFKGYDGFRFLKQQLIASVDELLKQHITKGDTRCDTVIAKIDPTKRASLIDEAKIHEVVEVALPKLVGDSMEIAPCSFRIRVQSKVKNVEVEFQSVDGSTNILSWLYKARFVELPIEQQVQSCWTTTDVEENLPELQSPYKYRKRADTISIYCSMADFCGNRVKIVQQRLGNIQQLTPHALSELVPKTIEALQRKVEQAEKAGESVI